MGYDESICPSTHHGVFTVVFLKKFLWDKTHREFCAQMKAKRTQIKIEIHITKNVWSCDQGHMIQQ